MACPLLMEAVFYDIKEKMGAKNVVDIYYHATKR